MLSLYDEFVDFERISGDQKYACCPFHNEKTASFTVNTTTQEWYCHGCHKGGAEREFIAEYFDVTKKIAEFAFNSWCKWAKMPFPTDTETEKLHQELLNSKEYLDILASYGITIETIKDLKLGLSQRRIIFPVKSRRGMVVNYRMYCPTELRGNNVPKCVNVKGLGQCRYYPYKAFHKDQIYIVEGEKDCAAARSQGFNAVTSTGGSAIPTSELKLFHGKDVVLMLDTDEVGRDSMYKYIKLLTPIAQSTSVVCLPNKDYVDFYKTHSPDRLDIKPYYMSYEEAQSTEIDSPTQEMSLTQSEYTENMNTWASLSNISVVGADPKTYTVPMQLHCRCNKQNCDRPCALNGMREGQITDIDIRLLLRFMDAPDSVQDTMARTLYACKSVQTKGMNYVNCQKLIFQEGASFIDGLDEASFENRYGVYMYTKSRLLPTKKYNFEACRVANPNNQQNYYLIREAECVSAQNSIENFNRDLLNDFTDVGKQFDTAEALIEYWYREWKPALGIESRPDLFGAILLTYCSVTEIPWQGGRIKGWLDSMVIGDTRTGKSQMAQRFVKLTHMGSYINGENARNTGVIGGVQRFGDSWVVTWGAIPMNDLGLLMIDEASGLEIEDIKELSSTRSSGAVTLNKIVKGEARARTRLLWFSNPRSGNNLSDFYWKGFGAFQEFIPVAEDQARFDLVLSAAREDVSVLHGIDDPDCIVMDQWRALFSFAWSLGAENIKFEQEVTTRIRDVAQELEEKYGGGPLIIGVAVHEKLLRLSCAFAVLLREKPGDDLWVSLKSVEFAKEFLVSTLEKPSLGYADYIREYKKAQAKRAENIDYVRTLISVHPAIKALLSASSFKGQQFQEILGLDKTDSAQIISDLIQKGLLRLGARASYVPDKFLMEIAKQMEV